MGTLMDSIRRATGKKRGEGDRENKAAEDEEETPAAENDRDETAAEEEEQETSAEDEETDTSAEEEEEETVAEEEEEDKEMSAADRAVFAKGRKAERKRIAAILGSKQADANPDLAAHLAFKTSDSAKKAVGVLQAGGKAAAAGLSGRMNGRTSRTGRDGGEGRRGGAADNSWDKAFAKAGVKVKS